METIFSNNKSGTVHTVQTLAHAEPGLNEGGIRWTIFQHKSDLCFLGMPAAQSEVVCFWPS